jgi:hypothetical protein
MLAGIQVGCCATTVVINCPPWLCSTWLSLLLLAFQLQLTPHLYVFVSATCSDVVGCHGMCLPHSTTGHDLHVFLMQAWRLVFDQDWVTDSVVWPFLRCEGQHAVDHNPVWWPYRSSLHC